MSVFDEYYAIRSRIQSAIASAQPELAGGLKQAVRRSADERVYSYAASEKALAKRRYQLGADSNLYAVISDAAGSSGRAGNAVGRVRSRAGTRGTATVHGRGATGFYRFQRGGSYRCGIASCGGI